MSDFVDLLINNQSSSDVPPVSIQLQGMARNSAFITQSEIESMVRNVAKIQRSVCTNESMETRSKVRPGLSEFYF